MSLREKTNEVLQLAHDHMRLYLPHYKQGHNVYDAILSVIESSRPAAGVDGELLAAAKAGLSALYNFPAFACTPPVGDVAIARKAREQLQEALQRAEAKPAGEPAASRMKFDEFIAEATRLGITAHDLVPALAARPEFADCLPEQKPAASARRVSVDAGALQMVRNALQRDADEGKPVRAEMLAALDATTQPADSAAKDREISRLTGELLGAALQMKELLQQLETSRLDFSALTALHEDCRKQLEAAQVDAERYRWLRDQFIG